MRNIILIITLLLNFNLFAKTGVITGLDIPRFVSLKSNDANLRVGPSQNYPILIKYIQKNLPIEVIDEFDVWRKVKDYQNNIGWLHKSLIKGERFVLINTDGKNNKKIHNRPNGKIIGFIQKNNIVELNKCIFKWCYIVHFKLEGWVSKKDIWGVYDKELYNQSFLQPLINQYWKILEYDWLNK